VIVGMRDPRQQVVVTVLGSSALTAQFVERHLRRDSVQQARQACRSQGFLVRQQANKHILHRVLRTCFVTQNRATTPQHHRPVPLVAIVNFQCQSENRAVWLPSSEVVTPAGSRSVTAK
jgi:hypothetical protein